MSGRLHTIINILIIAALIGLIIFGVIELTHLFFGSTYQHQTTISVNSVSEEYPQTDVPIYEYSELSDEERSMFEQSVETTGTADRTVTSSNDTSSELFDDNSQFHIKKNNYYYDMRLQHETIDHSIIPIIVGIFMSVIVSVASLGIIISIADFITRVIMIPINAFIDGFNALRKGIRKN